jgi:hypothetical protein
MSAFYVWDPSVSDDKRHVRFILTNGDVTSGTFDEAEFAASVLQEMKVDASIKSVSVTPFRSRYYSEYLDEDDWRAIWPVVWSYDLELRKPIVSWRVKSTEPLGTNATGTGRLVPGPKDKDVVACLVCAKFSSATRAAKATTQAESDADCEEFRGKYKVGRPKVRQSKLGKSVQLQLDLGRFSAQFFAKGADYAMRVQEVCEENHGVVHHGG